jgi:hypothetical protein
MTDTKKYHSSFVWVLFIAIALLAAYSVYATHRVCTIEKKLRATEERIGKIEDQLTPKIRPLNDSYKLR